MVFSVAMQVVGDTIQTRASKPARTTSGKLGVQLRIDRLGGQEHQRAIGGFAVDDVALRDRLDMDLHRRAKVAQRAGLRLLCPSAATSAS
jgi:hypothetical protein